MAAQFQEALDRQVEPLGLAAMDLLCPGEGEHILDIGCGCGQTSLALAARVRPTGSVVGVDISKPMLDVAFRRPRMADFAWRGCDREGPSGTAGGLLEDHCLDHSQGSESQGTQP